MFSISRSLNRVLPIATISSKLLPSIYPTCYTTEPEHESIASPQRADRVSHSGGGSIGAALLQQNAGPQAYEKALKPMADAGDHFHAKALVGYMWKHKISVRDDAHRCMLMAYCNGDAPGEALKYLRLISTKRLKPWMFKTVLKGCKDVETHTTTADNCWELFKTRVTEDLPSLPLQSADVWAARLAQLGAFYDVDKLDETWKEAQSIFNEDVIFITGAYAAALAKAGYVDRAMPYLEQLIEACTDHLPVDISSTAESIPPLVKLVQKTCNSLMRHAKRSRNFEEAAKVAAMMTMRGIPPASTTYNAMMQGLIGPNGNPKLAIGAFNEMQSLNLQPTSATRYIITRATAAAGEWGSHSQLEKHPIHYEALLKGYADVGDLDHMAETYHSLKDQGLSLSVDGSTALCLGIINYFKMSLKGAYRHGINHRKHKYHYGVQIAQKLLEEWSIDADDREKTPKLVTVLLRAWGEVKRPDIVMQLMEEYAGRYKKDKDRVSRLYRAAIVGLCRSGSLDEALHLKKEMIAEHMELTANVYAALIRGCAVRKEYRLGKEMVDSMKEKNIKMTLSVTKSLLKLEAACKGADDAVKLLRQLELENGISADVGSWSTIATAARRQGSNELLGTALSEIELLSQDSSVESGVESSWGKFYNKSGFDDEDE